MAQYWRTLNLDISFALRKGLDLVALENDTKRNGLPYGIWHYRSDNLTELLTPEWLEYMDSLGHPMLSAALFYRSPWYNHPEAHIDAYFSGSGPTCAINWVISADDDSKMVWYSVPGEEGQVGVTHGVTYTAWPMDKIKHLQVDERTIGVVPTLVNTREPHNIIMGSSPRWCVSVRGNNRDYKSWEDALEHFKGLIC